ncbi:phosphoribosyltransferase [Lusitaniella coriacea LEGE 07157]|uniref:Phosphoribosyltransferase n=1 Tax=Lusitaniella coriacea LEGE 07157 TaxID=945747 RepID=A0A8J7DWP6_9CYAN|nr:phosphoribosyltransferase family protein [Lusitaniella coriacea]MBE9116544.1 phosphoribosyltransferase [Lusitaniella coriacea LEGE 07157]
MPELYVSWSEYHQKIEILAAQIYQSAWDFNQIVCLAKGGLRVGDLLCRIYDKPLAILSASSYGGADNRIRGQIEFSQHLSMTEKTLGNRILLVDDLVDSGISLREAILWLQDRYGNEIAAIRTATIWHKSCSEIAPDYSVDYLPDNPWIHQPFEPYEQVTPKELASRYRRLAEASG